MSLTLERPAPRLHHLSFLEEGGEVVVGRTDIDSYGVFPPDGAALVRKLAAGTTPTEAERWYRETYGESVDMDEFMATLDDLQFLAADGEEVAGRAAGVRWQRLGRAVFSPAAWLLYGAIVLAAGAAMLADPDLAPRRSNIFFSDYLLVVELTLFAGQFPLSLFHELYHVLAGRRLGLRSRVRLSQRYYFLVWETVLDGLVAVPRRRRYLPMLAGMVADVIAISVLTLLAAATRDAGGQVSLLGGVCLALAFASVLRIAWQFYFYLRTDLYYLATTALGCLDLQKVAREMIGNRINRALGRTDRLVDEGLWHPRDRRAARWYAPVMVAGYAASTLMLVLVFLPLSWEFASRALRPLLDGTAEPAQVWDSVAILALTFFQFALAGYLAVRQRRRNRAETKTAGRGDSGRPAHSDSTEPHKEATA